MILIYKIQVFFQFLPNNKKRQTNHNQSRFSCAAWLETKKFGTKSHYRWHHTTRTHNHHTSLTHATLQQINTKQGWLYCGCVAYCDCGRSIVWVPLWLLAFESPRDQRWVHAADMGIYCAIGVSCPRSVPLLHRHHGENEVPSLPPLPLPNTHSLFTHSHLLPTHSLFTYSHSPLIHSLMHSVFLTPPPRTHSLTLTHSLFHKVGHYDGLGCRLAVDGISPVGDVLFLLLCALV